AALPSASIIFAQVRAIAYAKASGNRTNNVLPLDCEGSIRRERQEVRAFFDFAAGLTLSCFSQRAHEEREQISAPFGLSSGNGRAGSANARISRNVHAIFFLLMPEGALHALWRVQGSVLIVS